MKAAILKNIGQAEKVVAFSTETEPSDPKDGEIIVEIKSCPINPAEILMIEGKYATKPQTPCGLGIEGAGIVIDIGNNVTEFSVGDKVMSLSRTNWRQKICGQQTDFIKLSDDIDLEQASMLKVNLATAHLMIKNFVNLKAGDWIIQNASNSAVGINIIKLAKKNNFKTINIVRRDDLHDELNKLGADIIITDPNNDLDYKQIKNLEIKLAIDAIAGKATNSLAKSVANGATIINYGLLSGKNCEIDPFDLVFRDVKLLGFWMSLFAKSQNYESLKQMYQELSKHILDGSIYIPVEKSYKLEDVNLALTHAKKESRTGKIHISPNN